MPPGTGMPAVRDHVAVPLHRRRLPSLLAHFFRCSDAPIVRRIGGPASRSSLHINLKTRESARSYCAPAAARPRRRGDRVKVCCFAAVHESASGTQENVSPAAGGSGYGDAAEASGRGVGQPPMTHLGPERPILLRCEAQFPLNYVLRYGSRPMGGLGETASHYNPQNQRKRSTAA
jgi:hypothetical protein